MLFLLDSSLHFFCYSALLSMLHLLCQQKRRSECCVWVWLPKMFYRDVARYIMHAWALAVHCSGMYLFSTLSLTLLTSALTNFLNCLRLADGYFFHFFCNYSFFCLRRRKWEMTACGNVNTKRWARGQEYIEINWVPANVWDKLSRRFINNGALLIAAHSNRARLLYTENVIGLKRSNVGGWRFRLRVTGLGRHFRPFISG